MPEEIITENVPTGTPGATGTQEQTLPETLLSTAAGAKQADPEKPGTPDKGPEIPEKFRLPDGKLNGEAVLKSYSELEKRLGSGEAPPKSADEYKLSYKLPDGVEINKETEKAFLASCHARGMTNNQVQFVMDRYLDILGSQAQTQEASIKSAEAELKKSWGAEYDANLQYAVKAFDRLVDAGDTETINRIGNEPAILKILAKIGQGLKEDSPPVAGMGMSEEDVQALMKSPAYWNAKDPEHSRVKAKVETYFKVKAANTRRSA